MQLRAWAGSYNTSPVSRLQQFFVVDNNGDPAETTLRYFRLYALLSVITLLAFTARTAWTLIRALAAARKLYDQLIESVVSARTRFFDVVPGAWCIIGLEEHWH